MDKFGKLIFVTGVSGSGKSTLVKYALSKLEDLEYIKTVTTRMPRNLEEYRNSCEYEFVDFEKYNFLRFNSKNWDHSEYGGKCYGVDLSSINHKIIFESKNMILNVQPNVSEIQKMINLYPVQPVGVFVDTPKYVARRRISLERPETDFYRLSVENHVEYNHFFDSFGFLRFLPENDNLENSKLSFLSLITKILRES